MQLGRQVLIEINGIQARRQHWLNNGRHKNPLGNIEPVESRFTMVDRRNARVEEERGREIKYAGNYPGMSDTAPIAVHSLDVRIELREYGIRDRIRTKSGNALESFGPCPQK